MSRFLRTSGPFETRALNNVVIDPHTFSSFREFVQEEEERTGVCLVARGDTRRLALPAFEVRTTLFAPATFARLFDYDDALIRLVEGAQVHGLCLTITPLTDGGATISLGNRTDAESFLDEDGERMGISPIIAASAPLRSNPSANLNGVTPGTRITYARGPHQE